MEQNNTFENRIKDAFDGFEVNPPDRVLARIKDTVSSKQMLPARSRMIWRIAAGVAGGAIILTMAYFGLKESEQAEQIAQEKPVVIEQVEQAKIQETKAVAQPEISSEKKDEIPVQTKKAKPVLTANAGEDLIVCGLETELSTKFSNPSANGNWAYSSNDGRKVAFEKSDNSKATKVKVEEAGLYELQWTEELDGVSSADEVEVEFVLMNNISAGTDQLVCGLEVELKSTGLNGNWIALQESKIETPLNKVSMTRVYKYDVHQFIWVEKVGPCEISDTVAIHFVELPKAEIVVVKQAKCYGDPVYLKSPVKQGMDYSWDFNAATSSKIAEQEYQLTWMEGGLHTIALEVSNKQCQDKQLLTVDYPEEMQARFLVSDPGNDFPAMVYFTNMSTIGDLSYETASDIQFKWKFGDGKTSGLANPEYLYTREAIYFPVLEMTNNKSCKSTFYGPKLIVKDLKESQGTIVLTPNGDGKNDVFTVDASGFQSFTCVVLSLGGERLFSWTDPQGSWNGYLNDGSLAGRGTYYYIIKAVNLEGKPVEIPGIIYLYRE
ncbi:MAG: gliding motility-associated C-terminal domain-containing protein [Bacteroidales bacterium]|nr:gliding motility-associated C-terminal domain-containing protein [Bacteroidales bacterium]MCF8459041.1 gliding motility-associated C-terminal domain-containing protein [Bacteroidales bacterium]